MSIKSATLFFLIMTGLINCNCLKAQTPRFIIKWQRLPKISFLVVQATVAGKEGLLILDTGAPYSYLDRDFATGLNLETQKKNIPKFNEKIEYVQCDTEFSSKAFYEHNGFYILDDMSQLRQNFPEIVGILGLDLLMRFAVRFDFGKQEMELLEGKIAGTEREPKGAIKIPLNLYSDQMPDVEGKLDGLSALFTLDTGAERTFVSEPKLTKKLKPKGVVEGDVIIGSAPNGKGLAVSMPKTLRLATLQLGEAVWKNPIVNRFADKNRRAGNALGVDFLSQHKVIVDYKGGIVYLTPDPDYKGGDDWIGIGADWRWENRFLTIIRLWKPSPAVAAGLEIEDQVVEVDGQPLEGKKLEEVAAIFRGKKKIGNILSLKIKRDGKVLSKEFKIEIKQYL